MSNITRRILVPMFALTLAAAASGCAARVYSPGAAVAVETAPPPLRYEAVPVAPGPDYVWAGGYWSWGGAQYVWVPGRYVVRPGAHYVYRRPVWVRQGRRYHYRPGGWSGSGRVVVRGRRR
jgi:hypothetical protein